MRPSRKRSKNKSCSTGRSLHPTFRFAFDPRHRSVPINFNKSCHLRNIVTHHIPTHLRLRLPAIHHELDKSSSSAAILASRLSRGQFCKIDAARYCCSSAVMVPPHEVKLEQGCRNRSLVSGSRFDAVLSRPLRSLSPHSSSAKLARDVFVHERRLGGSGLPSPHDD